MVVRKGKNLTKHRRHQPQKQQPIVELEDSISQAKSHIENCNPELAQTLLLQLQSTNPNNPELIQLLGIATLEILNTGTADPNAIANQAKQYFSLAIQLSPEQGHEKYLYMAQLIEAEEALTCYRKAIQLLEFEIGNASGDERKALQTKASSCLCAIIEIYMTDCCDHPEAEQICTTHISQALSLSPDNPEVQSTLSSLSLSKNLPQEATIAIQKSISLWSSLHPNDYPSYANRLQSVKLCLELSLYGLAEQVLDTLQRENDEDVEVWYLYGWGYYSDGKTKQGKALAGCWDDARDCFERVLNLQARFQNTDPEILEHVSELMNEITPFLNANKELLLVDEDEEGDWEDDDSDGMEM